MKYRRKDMMMMMIRKLPSLWREGAGGGRGDPNQVLLSNPNMLQDQAEVFVYSLFQAFGFESIEMRT